MPARLAIPIAPNRASGPKWEKSGRKMEFGPTGKKRRKMGKLAQKWVKNAHFPIFRPFFFLFSGGAQFPFFGHFFPISGRRPDLGSVQGNLAFFFFFAFFRFAIFPSFPKEADRIKNTTA